MKLAGQSTLRSDGQPVVKGIDLLNEPIFCVFVLAFSALRFLFFSFQQALNGENIDRIQVAWLISLESATGDSCRFVLLLWRPVRDCVVLPHSTALRSV